MANYGLRDKLAAADPKPVRADDYEPAARPRECPAVRGNWTASAASLPPTPDPGLCDCMVEASSCVPAPGLPPRNMSQLFGHVCSSDPSLCAGIAKDPEAGVYGAFSMCDGRAQLVNILDAYHRRHRDTDARA